MTPETFIHRFQNNIVSGLPGEKAHRRLMPANRMLYPDNSNPQKSAVLLIVDFPSGIPSITFIKRTVYNGAHSGQIAFPGGKCDTSLDRTPLDTAIRETIEEIGFCVRKNQIIGELSPLFIPVSDLMVHPFVAVVPALVYGRIDYREVEEVFKIPISDLRFDSVKMGIFEGKNYRVEAPYWEAANHKIWGATAMILSEFLELSS